MSSHSNFSFDINLGAVAEPQVQTEYCNPQTQRDYVSPAQQRMDNIASALQSNQVRQAAELLREDSLYHPAEALQIAKNLQWMSQHGQIPESVTCGADRWGRPDYQISSQFGVLDVHDGRVTEQQSLAPPVPTYNYDSTYPPAGGAYNNDSTYYPAGGTYGSDSTYPSAGTTYNDSVSPSTAPCDNSAAVPSCPESSFSPYSYPSYDAPPQVSFSFAFGSGGGFNDGRCNVPHGCGMPRAIMFPSHHALPHVVYRRH